MAERSENNSSNGGACGACKTTFGQKCKHMVKKQRARFYIVRRCIAMLVCWRDRGDS
ncbi:PREDICTED: uncharacterized protein LOC109116388 [Tarenaya hassleriana]|uniref:uncharacterized protein LOC109116388 n=1 Tax=Tarenaya hassleriana TaxID=28532 RepID=UPI0008FD4A31|nr:PREDICTED: uncharacterized protein LOC109116388 [Tarenaya hassleriana]